MIHAGKFHTDRARTHNDHRFRHAGQFEYLIRVDDLLPVHLKTRNRPHDRAGGDDDVLGVDRLLFAAFEFDLNLAFAGDLAKAVENRDLVLFHQIGNAGRVFGDHIRLILLNAGPIVAQVLDLETEVLKMRRFVVQMGRVQQRLGRDAAAQAAGSAKPRVFFFFNQRDL